MSVPKRIPVKKSTATWAGPVSIRKRSGDVVPFDAGKIREAIRKAHVATREEVLPPGAIDELARRVVRAIPSGQIPTVEQVQDLVEEALIQAGYAKTAKAYILYRAEHAKIRQSETDLMEIYKELTFSYAADADIKRENANIDADTSMGTMLKYGSEGAKYFVDNYILPRDVAAAHINGDIHIHDKDFYMLTETCWSRRASRAIPPWAASPSRQIKTRCTADKPSPTLIFPWRRGWPRPSAKSISKG